jgi:NAD(P)-dependent dehydrogenase (short-subunit alcohol dehydrogenase family)
MAKLEDKVALISGGTSGIGAATARLFQSEGATVIVTGSSERSVEAAKAELPGIEALVSNAGDPAATRALVETVKARHSRIDVLFVNAGVAQVAAIEQVDEAFFDSLFDVNVKGAFFLMKHAIPIIPDGGAIVLTASVAGAYGGMEGATVYGATKAALRSFGRTFAKALLPRGIRVNTVSPGPIVTPILDKEGFTPEQKTRFIEGAKTRIPLGRTGTPEEVAAAVLYLAADATYTTGAELFVDGGLIDL